MKIVVGNEGLGFGKRAVGGRGRGDVAPRVHDLAGSAHGSWRVGGISGRFRGQPSGLPLRPPCPGGSAQAGVEDTARTPGILSGPPRAGSAPFCRERTGREELESPHGMGVDPRRLRGTSKTTAYRKRLLLDHVLKSSSWFVRLTA